MMNFNKICTVLAVVIPIVITGMGYINHLKTENERLKIEYLTAENLELKESMTNIDDKLDKICSTMDNNGRMIVLLKSRLNRTDIEQEKIRNRLFGG